MINFSRKIYPFYILIDLFFISLSFLISYYLRYKSNILGQNNFPHFEEYVFSFTLFSIFIIISFKSKSLYSTDRSWTIPIEISKVIISIFYIAILMSTVIFFAKFKFFSRQIFLWNFFLLSVFLSSWRVAKRLFLRKLILNGFHNLNILIVGTDFAGKSILEEIKRNPFWGLKVVGFLNHDKENNIDGIPIIGKLDDLPTVAKKYFVDDIIVTIPVGFKEVSDLVKQAKKLNLGIRIIPENFEETTQIINISYLGTIPLLTYKERKHHPTELFLKRSFDFAVSLFLIILLLPLFIFIAILIKLDNPGAILYIQKRVGLKGKIFNLYKFRSMTKDADELKSGLLEKNEVKDGIIFKIRKDPRITKLGQLLRRYSLDELPQLINVLKGDMSLVGPRPPIPSEVEKYSHFQMDRLSIRPGLTGLSQIKGRSELTFRKWVKWDLWYVNNWSFILDLKILLWTIPAVTKGKGAY